jgi:hypothetical protein
MISKSFAVMGVLMLLSVTAHAAAAPKELYGKSTIVTWTEHRNQRQLGQTDFRDVDVSLSRKIYISTKGQWFDRHAELHSECVSNAPGAACGVYYADLRARAIDEDLAGHSTPRRYLRSRSLRS